ncbi:hypothetical protein AGMMS50267_13580 [Spirochaetia bacterium]|nr:hypothetical protein AGMMS50267_13580 [Spirochaetia bacterium]
MMRIEIVANHSVEEDLFEAFKDAGVGKFYTRYDNVFGVGTSGPRMGDAIWPEVNFALVFWCELDEARGIANAVAKVKKHFPDEGIKLFGLPDPKEPVYALPAPIDEAALASAVAVAVADAVAAVNTDGTITPQKAPRTARPVKPVKPPDFGGETF